ncbi:uncharacterized protein [Argopecten irradians]|uniref:uncharacterized protein n=1 Tax=Argopecten irradians TaxID=31199 RepID=UPI00371B2665
MKENLLFGGLPERGDNTAEDTEKVVKDFISNVLDIPDEIPFQVVHRLRPRNDGKPRSIVAKFCNRKDREKVLNAVPDKLADKKQFSVYEQFPPEINERRKVLYPIFKEAKRRGQSARLKEDRLYINNQLQPLPQLLPPPGFRQPQDLRAPPPPPSRGFQQHLGSRSQHSQPNNQHGFPGNVHLLGDMYRSSSGNQQNHT